MGYSIGILLIFLLSIDIAVLTKKRMEIIIPFSFSIVGIFIYIIFCIQLGKYSIGIIVTFIFILTIILICQHRLGSNIIKLITPGTVLWIVLCIIISMLYKNRYTLGGDEHSMWAMAVKHMYYNDTFSCAGNSNVSFKYYIPGMACLEYFFMKLNETYSDAILYKTLSTWVISLGLPLLKNVGWKEYGNLIFRAALCIFFPFFFCNSVFSLANSEGVIIMLLAYILSVLFIEEREGKFFIFWLGIMLASLASIKSAGSSFSFFILLILIVDEYFKEKNIKSCLKMLNIPAIFLLTVSLLWQVMLKVYEYINITPYASTFSFQRLLDIIIGKGSEYDYEILSKFMKAFVNSHLTQGNGKPFVSNIVFLFIIIIMCYMCSEWIGRKRAVALSINICICTLFYFIGMLYVYMFSFYGIESLSLASYKRYSSLWFGEVIIFLIILILYNREQCKEKSKNFIKILFKYFPVMLSIYIICNLYIVFKVYNGYFVFTRDSADKAYTDMCHVEEYKRFLTEDDRVYIVSQDSGYNFLYAKYLLTPISCADEYLKSGSGIRTWKLGTENMENEKFYTVNEWSEILKDFTYVYIHNIDDSFIDRYDNIFMDSIREKSIYKIINKNGSIRLSIVNNK